ncbi:3Beta-HSD domain-containing protein [Favolaschia claudopus]|uniref:3Beta-HSD domain-containing protein n=1 Tax=Favolaschia claudopus TaxID=2862362 RepID=A0AAW0E1Y7_9AGAR
MSQDKPTGESYLIVGGGTSLGEAIVRLLLCRGEARVSVFDALPLAPEQVAEFGDRVRVFVGEILAPKVVSDAIRSCEATCIISTGMVSIPPVKNIRYPSAYASPLTSTQDVQVKEELRIVHRRTSIEGNRNLVSAIFKNSVKQLVYFGSAESMFNGTERPNLREDDVPCFPKPWIPKLEVAAVGERIVLDAHGQMGLAVAVIRPAILFGPTYDQYMALNRSQAKPQLSAVCAGDNTKLSDMAYTDNAAHAGILAADRLAVSHPRHSATIGRAFIVSDGDPRPTWDLPRDLWAAASHTTPPTPVRVPVKSFYSQPGALAKLLGRKEIRGEKNRAWFWYCATRTYDISLARDVLGYEPIVSHDEGIRRTAEWWLSRQRKLKELKEGSQTAQSPGSSSDNPPPAYGVETNTTKLASGCVF